MIKNIKNKLFGSKKEKSDTDWLIAVPLGGNGTTSTGALKVQGHTGTGQTSYYNSIDKKPVKLFGRITSNYVWFLFYNRKEKRTHKLRIDTQEIINKFIYPCNPSVVKQPMLLVGTRFLMFNTKWKALSADESRKIWNDLQSMCGFEVCKDPHKSHNPDSLIWD